MKTAPESPICVPAGYDRVQLVYSDADFVRAKFNERVNVIAWIRSNLAGGDFKGLAQEMANFCGDAEKTSTVLEFEDFMRFAHTAQARRFSFEVAALSADLGFTKGLGYNSQRLRLVKKYPDQPEGSHCQHQEEFHPDSADEELGRLIICYDDPTTEYVRNQDVEIFSEFPKIKPDAQTFSFPAGTMVKHFGHEMKGPVSAKRLQKAAYHKGRPAEYFCPRLAADRS